ncbi:MAG TPA: ABC transporter ATP-binding protein [Clostridiales bacterium]|nr:ABC transporter ATP-binding protein [Clostridiales bacterium]
MGKVIEIFNLKKYYGDHMGIEDVSFSVDQGQIFGFIGPNGAGKSTTIRILMGLLFPTSGTARIFSKDVTKFDEQIKSSVGYVPAEAIFYKNFNASQIFEYSAKLRGCSAQRVRELVELFELDVKKKGKELSFGNAKKVSIILALMHSPDLLLMDEPTSGLDPVMQQRFFDLIEKERQRGATVLLSTHILNDVQKVCDQAAIIKKGKIADVINVKELSKEKGNLEQTFLQYYI